MWPRNLAPDDPNLAASDLPLAAVDVCDLLAAVESTVGTLVSIPNVRLGGMEGAVLRSLLVFGAFDLDERGARVRDTLSALVGDVLAPSTAPLAIASISPNNPSQHCAGHCLRRLAWSGSLLHVKPVSLFRRHRDWFFRVVVGVGLAAVGRKVDLVVAEVHKLGDSSKFVGAPRLIAPTSG